MIGPERPDAASAGRELDLHPGVARHVDRIAFVQALQLDRDLLQVVDGLVLGHGGAQVAGDMRRKLAVAAAEQDRGAHRDPMEAVDRDHRVDVVEEGAQRSDPSGVTVIEGKCSCNDSGCITP